MLSSRSLKTTTSKAVRASTQWRCFNNNISKQQKQNKADAAPSITASSKSGDSKKVSTEWEDYLKPGEDRGNAKFKKIAKDRMRKATANAAHKVKKGLK